MPTYQSLKLYEGNDETLTGLVTDDTTGLPLDLTDVTLVMRIKTSAQTADDDAEATLSTTTGEITVTDPAAGAYSVAVPGSALATAGARWYRVDATTGASSTRTVAYGPLQIANV